MRPARGSQALSLVELMVACFLLGLLLAVLFLCYRTGALAWRKAEAKTAVLAELQTVVADVSRHLERTTASGVTLIPGAVSILSALDQQGQVVFDSTREELVWQRFFVYYHHSTSHTVRRRNLPLASESVDPVAFAEATGTSLSSAVALLQESDKVLTHRAKVLEFELEPVGGFGGLIRISLQAEKETSSSQREILELESMLRIRN